MSRVLDLLDRYKDSEKRRDSYKPLYQALADVLYPARGGFTAEVIPGAELSQEIYDTTPQQARRGLATAIDGMLKPATSSWFWMKARNDALNEGDAEKRWLDQVKDRMRSAIYDPEAGFIKHSSAVDNDLAVFGWGALFIGERRNKDGLKFASQFIGDVCYDENSDTQIDTVYTCLRLTARQAKQKWKQEGQLGPKVLEALNSDKAADKDRKFTFVECIHPREDRDPRFKDNLNMPFASVIICVEDQNEVEESGYPELPLAIPRWEIPAGHIYPRSPGMIALADARTLQSMGKTLLIGGQMAVDPPRWVVDDGVMSAVRTWPGGLTVVNADTVRDTGGKPIGTMESGANIPIGREMQDDYRKMVEAAFFRNVFNLPQDGPDMTATEIIERKEEFLRTIAPTMGQLESSYIGTIVNRVFGIMQRAGAFSEPPESLLGEGAKFEFMSPIQQAKKQMETAALGRSMELLGPMLELKPEAADNFDVDEIVRDLPEAIGMPQKWLVPLEKRDELRQQRADAMEAQMGLQEAQQGADIANTVVDAGATAQQMQQGGAPSQP